MHIALFVSTKAIQNLLEPPHRGRPAEYLPGINRKSRFTKRVIVIPNCKDLYRQSEGVVAYLEEMAHIGLKFVERLCILIERPSLGVVEPLAREVPRDKLIWLLEKGVRNEARAIITGSITSDHNIVRARSGEESLQMGEMVSHWLTGERAAKPLRDRPSREASAEPSRR